jgi:hypothetical protein
MSNQPDIRDVPSSWDYNLMMILATVFVAIAIVLAYLNIQSMQQWEAKYGDSLDGVKKDPVSTITTLDGKGGTEDDIISGFPDTVNVRLTQAEIDQYHQIRYYVDGVKGDQAKLEIENKCPYLKVVNPDNTYFYAVTAEQPDFGVFQKYTREKLTETRLAPDDVPMWAEMK